MKIEYVEGIPRWFTWLVHHWNRRRCRKVGHVYTAWRSCNRCGGYN